MLAAALAAQDGLRIVLGLGGLAELGYAPSEETLRLLAPHVPAEEMAALRLRFDANRAVVRASRLFTTVPDSGRLIEGIAWDPAYRRLFASSVVGRELLYTDGETWRAVPGFNPGSLFGLAIDDARRLIWVASGAVEQTPSPETAFRGLIALSIDDFRIVHRIATGPEGGPGDIALGADGTLYAADPARGTIWRVGVGDSVATILVPPGRLQNPQGMVPSIDRRRLYVADYVYGLALVDTNDGAVTRLESGVTTMLDGIDGLLPWRGGLLAIQNGTSPRRIIHLTLDSSGRRITGSRVVESAHPDWGEPTLGFIRRGNLVYVADAQWERYGAGGVVTGEGPTRPTAIREARLPR
ncbi:MAG: hypothetical protein AB7O91_10340 [Sphingomonas sp.]